MVLYIKNMICLRCKQVVQQALEDLHLPYREIELGCVTLTKAISAENKLLLKQRLLSVDLDLVEGSKGILVAKIKNRIFHMIQQDAAYSAIKTSHYLSDSLNYNYTYLANVFSQETGICLSDFIIAHKIEKAKEMLVGQGLTVSEIAWKLKYSSVAHLSNQFIKVTGQRPSQYKKSISKSVVLLDPLPMMEAV